MIIKILYFLFLCFSLAVIALFGFQGDHDVAAYRNTATSTVSATVKEKAVISQNKFVFHIPVDLMDGKTTQVSQSVTVKANASTVFYSLILCVEPSSLDQVHHVYLATNKDGFQVPFEIRLRGGQSIPFNSEFGLIAANLSGTNLKGTQYEIVLTEATSLKGLYASSPAGIYTITVLFDLRQRNVFTIPLC